MPSLLEIDLNRVQENYKELSTLTFPSICAAVVKADGYGMGALEVSKALLKVGCYRFYTATLEEALTLRNNMPGHYDLLVFHGLQSDNLYDFINHNLTPVLCHYEHIDLWKNVCRNRGKRYPCAVHIDSAMNRTGLIHDDWQKFLDNDFEGLHVVKLLSHLSSADDMDSPTNRKQLETIQDIQEKLPFLPVSFANSHGIFLGKEFHFQETRPGFSLYGLNNYKKDSDFLKPAMRLRASIIQQKTVQKGESIGYNGTFNVGEDMNITTLGIGYAQGVPWGLASKSHVYIGDFKAPIVGKVSMDLITIDTTNVPEQVMEEATFAELLNDKITLFDWQDETGCSAYELLTNLGKHPNKVYTKF